MSSKLRKTKNRYWICVIAAISIGCASCGGGYSPSGPFPTVAISVNPTSVPAGSNVTVTWSSTNATFCAGSGAWTGTPPISGSQTVTTNGAGNLTYTLACTGAGGTAYGSATVNATVHPVSLSNTFSPNSTTISTSEGAPFGFCDFWTQAPNSHCDNESNFGYGPTRVMHLQICLSGEVPINTCSQQPEVTGPLSSAMVDDINSRLAAYAGTGMRLVVRFTYNQGPIGPGAMDAPIDVISEHIDQLAPTLLHNKDLILALEAGFIGTWGEWHDSTNGNDTAAAHKIVLDKELSYFKGVFPILVRCPGDLIQYTGTPVPPAGLGIHDDYYASNSSDASTWSACSTRSGFCVPGYTTDQLQSYGASVSTTTMFAAEFGALYPPLQSCSALSDYSYTYHLQSITLTPFPPDIGTELQNEGCALDFYNRVGTRIELQTATITGTPIANGKLRLTVTLVNAGYGRVIRPRPASLIFVSGGNVVAQFPIALAAMDLRQLASSATPVPQTFQFSVTLPASFPSSGPVSAALLIPDPAPSLTSQPACALPLNSVDQNNHPVFDPTTGYNVIASFNAE